MTPARKLRLPPPIFFPPPPPPPPPAAVSPLETVTDRITKLINEHPFPSRPLLPLLERHLGPPLLSPELVEAVLFRLFRGHANSLKSLELLRFSLRRHLRPSQRAFDAALHALARAGELERAWELLEEAAAAADPSLLSSKSMGILLAKYAKFRTFEETMEAFERMEKVFVGREFGVDEFNVLLRAFCARRQVLAARAVFRRLHARFPPNSRTMNTLLLGFKETGNLMAMDMFFHEMILRGFAPDVVTFNIRIDGYCKKGRIREAMRFLQEMEEKNCSPTLETMTTLVHGAGVAKDASLARRLFDEMPARYLTHDAGAYNALMAALVRGKDQSWSAVEMMEEMEEKGIVPDDVTYHTALWGLTAGAAAAAAGDEVCGLYRRMVEKNFVPATRTVVALMKFFCENRRVDFGLSLWRYLVGKGCCPHGHALDLLVTALCCRGRVEEACSCFKEVVERGRRPPERSFRVVEGFLLARDGGAERVEELKRMMEQLGSCSSGEIN
ncbi:unnamed protein product [Spirodela intermedia]|uniref:Uncharacterized protein n=1 Tax=Spirodela intermedia TaxID=51605 RepID=A0A7I8LH28_SPIIN|nr:unnamed protein product [Spirodela intermedia]